MTGNRKQKTGRQLDAPLAEWTVGALGLLLIAAVIAVLLHEALSGRGAPPTVSVSVLGTSPQQNGWLVEIGVRNEGATTAGGLTIEGSLRSGDRVIEASEASIDYLPPRSQREAGLFFTRDPRDFELEIRPMGYQEP